MIIDLDAGPYFKGLGDLVLLSYLPVSFKTKEPAKIELAKLLGKKVEPGPGRNLFPAYAAELREQGGRSRLEVVKEFLRLDHHETPTVTIPDDAKAWASRFRSDVILFPKTQWASRSLPTGHWLWIADRLQRSGLHTLTVMPVRDDDFATAPAVLCGLSITQLAALVEASRLVVGNDSFPAHFGGLLRPTLACLGPTRPTVFSHCPMIQTITSGRSCTGCHFGPPSNPTCAFSCVSLAMLDPDNVVAKVKEMLNG